MGWENRLKAYVFENKPKVELVNTGRCQGLCPVQWEVPRSSYPRGSHSGVESAFT